MKRYQILAIFFFCAFAAEVWSAQPPKDPVNNANNCSLSFGWISWIPLQYIDKQGNLTGIQINLVNAIAEKLNCKVEFVHKNWGNIIEDIRLGKIDFTANASIADYRENFAYFSHAYRRDTFGVYVKSEKLKKFNVSSIEELKTTSFRLGLTEQQLYGDEIEAWIKDPKHSKKLSFVKLTQTNIERLINDEIDGYLDDPFIVAYKQRIGQIPYDVVRLPIKTFGHKVSFMFSKKNIDLEFIDRFNIALKEIQNSPEFQSVWLNAEFSE